MKILLTHRFFWPDSAPYARMLREIGDSLADAGHDVHILSGLPSYRDDAGVAPATEVLGKINVRRIKVFEREKQSPPRRMANVFVYCVAIFWRVLSLRPDLVTASTFPPVIAAWTASLAARLVGADFVYHVQDIHPEISSFSGGKLGRGLAERLLRVLDNQTLRRSTAVVVLSGDMETTLRNRGIAGLSVETINNLPLVNTEPSNHSVSEYRKDKETVRAIFAGNIGRFQNLDTLVEGVSEALDANPGLELFFLGDGAALSDLKSKWGGHSQIRFAPFLPFEKAQMIIREADIGLVSLGNDIFRAAFPSKIQSYLHLGLPVFLFVEPESEMARTIIEEGLGYVPKEHTAAAITAEISRAISSPVSRAHIDAWARLNLSSESILDRWKELILKIETRRSGQRM